MYEKAINIIQKHVAVRFIQGWRIYLDYFLLRAINMEIEQIAKFVGLNYEITFVDCERVCNLLKNTPEIFYRAEKNVTSINKMHDQIKTLREKLLAEKGD